MAIIYQAKIVDEQTQDTLIAISSYSEEGLTEEMSKTKWTEAVEKWNKSKVGEELDEQDEPEDEDKGANLE